MKKVFAALFAAVMSLNLIAANKIIVPKDAPSIEAALERAEAGDTVFVSKGIYKETVTLKDEVALIGESVEGTVIRGNGRGAVVKGANKALIRNLTIENGDKGILCENVSMTIENNCVCSNKTSGIHCLVTLPMLRNNVVYRNKATGIFCETVRSLNTLIEHNVFAENGNSGMMLAGKSEVIVQSNVFIGNKQFGIWVNDGARRSRIVNNNFYMNRIRANFYAQIDGSNIAVDPGYPKDGSLSGAYFFSGSAPILKGKGKDGGDIGLITMKEMIERGLDVDNDGVPDAKDHCVSIQEDTDGFQDDDGCPDFDNDNDGMYDTQDKCPNGAEDMDGFEDNDGCPDLDNDKDGIPDEKDVCPGNPETVNGYKDDDGCPDIVPAGGAQESGQAPAPATPEQSKAAPVPAPVAPAVAPAPVAAKPQPAVAPAPATAKSQPVVAPVPATAKPQVQPATAPKKANEKQ